MFYDFVMLIHFKIKNQGDSHFSFSVQKKLKRESYFRKISRDFLFEIIMHIKRGFNYVQHLLCHLISPLKSNINIFVNAFLIQSNFISLFIYFLKSSQLWFDYNRIFYTQCHFFIKNQTWFIVAKSTVNSMFLAKINLMIIA